MLKNKKDIAVLKTCTELDQIISCNGLPYNKITELSGDIDSYKTSISLQIVKSVLSQDNTIVLYFDVDYDLDHTKLSLYNLINNERFFLCKTTDYKEIISIIKEYKKIKSWWDTSILIVIDSIANIINNDQHVKTVMTIKNFLNQLSGIIYDSENMTVLVTNQMRYNPEKEHKVRFCSKIMELYCTYRLHIRSINNKKLNIVITKDKIYNKITANEI